jgi:DNA-binding transcriptional ArsR family regulator
MVIDANSLAALGELSEEAANGHADSVDRVLRALNHPVRRRILQELSEAPASASTLAKRFGEELGMVSYHLNQVLAKECGVVELVDTIARRGALEKIYGLDPKAWEQLAHDRESGTGSYGLFTLEVDDSTWREICEAREEFEERIAAAVEGGHRRGVGIGLRRTRPVIVGVATFFAGAPSNGALPYLEADDRT